VSRNGHSGFQLEDLHPRREIGGSGVGIKIETCVHTKEKRAPLFSFPCVVCICVCVCVCVCGSNVSMDG